MLEVEVRQRFDRARESGAGLGPLTLIVVEATATIVAFAANESPPQIFRLTVGGHTLGPGLLRSAPPTPLALENAIAVVEDEVMPLAKQVPNGSTLVGTGNALHDVARAAGHTFNEDRMLTINDVERLFQQLAALVQGRPFPSSGLPDGNGFAASLLILREFMHHLGFAQIRLQT